MDQNRVIFVNSLPETGRIDWSDVGKQLRARPMMWAIVNSVDKPQYAYQCSKKIRTHQYAVGNGTFESVVRHETGKWNVYARFMYDRLSESLAKIAEGLDMDARSFEAGWLESGKQMPSREQVERAAKRMYMAFRLQFKEFFGDIRWTSLEPDEKRWWRDTATRIMMEGRLTDITEPVNGD